MNGEETQTPGFALLGIEIGRNKVRLALLDPDGKSLDDAIERPILKGGGPRDPMEEESSTRAAIEAGLERLGVTRGAPLSVGVTIGFPHCGVGSGPALRGWLGELSLELGEPIVHIGHYGVSYAPVHCIDFTRRVFEPTMLNLDRIDLAPVSASRAVEGLRSAAITLGSGVAWSARILDHDVLEAFEVVDGAFDEPVHVLSNGVVVPVEQIDGIYLDENITRARGINPVTLAPAVGVAIALREGAGSNLLDGQIVTGSTGQHAEFIPRVESRLSAPLAERPGRGEGPQPRWDAGEVRAAPPPPELRPVTARENAQDLRNGLPEVERLLAGPIRQPASQDEAQRRLVREEPRHDEFAGIESFAPEATGLDSKGVHIPDVLLGALLMLAVILLITLVVL